MVTAAPAARAAARKTLWTQLLMGAPLVLLLVTLLVYPVGELLLLSVHGENGFTLAPYRQLFASSVYVDVLLITLKISLFTTLLSVIAGYPVAYLISMMGRERKTVLLTWVLLSFWTSFLVRAFAWVVLLGRNGMVNKLLISLGILDAPASLLYNFGAVLVGMVHALLPLAVLTMLSVMENIDGALPRAAATLGARPGTAFWKIYFPLSLPGVTAAAIMVFVTAIGFFIVPALLGGRRETMITQLIIDQVQQTLNWGFAGAISVLLLLVVLAVFWLYDAVLGLSSMTGASDPRRAAASRSFAHRIGDAVLTLLGALTWSCKASSGRS
jgi:putative spermidine/putrescine transport system permease protein